MTPRDRANAAFVAAFGEQPARWFQAPGRVNLIGEHTDYNEGFVLPCAIDRQTVVAWGPAPADIAVIAADADDRDDFVPVLPIARAGAAWANYVRGVADELLNAGHAIAPARLAVAGNVPLGAGLSSSASLEVAVAFALTAGQVDPTDAAILSQRAENNFVGCNCGIMDQLVSATGAADHALLIDCRSLERRLIPLPPDCALVVIDSGVRHAHTDSGYNARRAECDRAVAHYGVAALRDLDLATLEVRRGNLDAIAYARARHVVTENARVLAAADALEAGALEAMGALMAESHRSMRDDFEITVPEVDRIVETADSVIKGRGGARMTGGGFGGSIVALVPTDLVSPLIGKFDPSVMRMSVLMAAAGAGAVT